MLGSVRGILVVAMGLLVGLDCSVADAGNACNSGSIRLAAQQGSATSYIAAIRAISDDNNSVSNLFEQKLRTLGIHNANEGYLVIKKRDPGFIDALRRKQKNIDQRMLDLIERHGLPVASTVGTIGMMSAVSVMANTFDPDYAAKFAELWKQGCAKRMLPCIGYALIEDNALLVRDGIQRFGTISGVPFAKNTSDKEVNEERAKMGLSPLSQACMDSITKPQS